MSPPCPSARSSGRVPARRGPAVPSGSVASSHQLPTTLRASNEEVRPSQPEGRRFRSQRAPTGANGIVWRRRSASASAPKQRSNASSTAVPPAKTTNPKLPRLRTHSSQAASCPIEGHVPDTSPRVRHRSELSAGCLDRRSPTGRSGTVIGIRVRQSDRVSDTRRHRSECG